MTVFVSYASKDVERVTALQRDLGAIVGGGVWIDSELHGGQQWWSAILDQIRSCDLFVFALSPRSLRSEACMAELSYAVATNRPLLPVIVGDVGNEPPHAVESVSKTATTLKRMKVVMISRNHLRAEIIPVRSALDLQS